MNREEVLTIVEGIFRNVFRANDLQISDDLTANEVTNWDSLTHIDMIIAVEDRFEIKIPTLKASKLKNVGELIDLISENL